MQNNPPIHGLRGPAALHPRFWYFIVGICVYLLSRPRESEVQVPTMSEVRAWPLEPILGFAFIAAIFSSHNFFLPLALLSGGMGFWVVVRQKDLLSRLLRTPVMQYLGTISYSWCLWHTFVLYVTKRIFARDGGLLGEGYVNLAVLSLVSLAGSIVTAQLSYHWVEVRATRWLLARTSRKKNAEEEPAQGTAEPLPPVRSAG